MDDQSQHVHGAQAQVGQVADRRGHQVERPFGILLAAGHLLCRLEQQIDIEGHDEIPGR